MIELSVAGLEKSFGPQKVLSGVDLVVPAGSFTAVLGPSGSGKTTLLRLIAGFEAADRGCITIGDVVVDDAEGNYVVPEKRRIGYVPQEGALFPHLNVAKNVGFGLHREPGNKARIDELLEMVGLSGMHRRYPHQLSGGQQQRVALARALAISPGLVLLDEPFSSLDASMRASVRADVQLVLRQAGTTAVLVTHDQDEALSMADHVAVIRAGRIGQVDSPEALYTQPRDAELARFVGEANLLTGELDGRSVRTPLGVLPLHPGVAFEPGVRTVNVLVRPEQLELIREPAGAYLTGRILDYQYFGHDAIVRIRPDGGDGSELIVVRITGGSTWRPDTVVGLSAKGPVLAWPATDDPATPSSVRPGRAK